MANESNPKRQEITAEDNWFIGEDKAFEFTIYNEDGSLADITGMNFEWVVRLGPSSDTQLLLKNGVNAAVDPDSHTVTVFVDREDTVDWSPGSLYHTLRRTDAGLSTVEAYGAAVIRWAATR